MGDVVRNVRIALRSLGRMPVYTACVLLVLAIGIGANTLIFTIVDAVLLRPLPYADPDGLYLITETQPRRAGDRTPTSAPNYLDWRSQNNVFTGVLAFRPDVVTLSGVEQPEELDATEVTDNTFSLLGVQPMLGRAFLPNEGQRGAERVVIISHKLWQRRFQASPTILGKTMRLNDMSYPVVGVMPPDFQFPPGVTLGRNTITETSDVWLPLSFTDQELQNRQYRFLRVIGRAKPGVSAHSAASGMKTIAQRLAAEHASTNAGWGVNVIPLRENVVGDVRTPLLVILAAVAFVLLLTCSNIAHMALARSTARAKEITTRLALGASRRNIANQLLTEQMALGFVGSVLGVGVASVGLAVLPKILPPGLVLPGIDQAKIDVTVLAFALIVGVITAILFGLAPIRLSFSLNLIDVLRSSERLPGGGPRAQWTRSLLVSSQIAMSVVLLVGAGLMLKSFLRLMSTDLGFRTENVLTVPITLPQSRFPDAARMSSFCSTLERETASIPGVQVTGAVTILPVTGQNVALRFTKHGEPRARGDELTAGFRFATPTYLKVMRIPLLQGRALAETDDQSRTPVVIIDQGAARRYWPGQDPVGERINVMGEFDATVVGVVGSVRNSVQDTESAAMIYLALAQAPADVLPAVGRHMTFVLRTSGDPASIAQAVRQTVLRADPDQAVTKIMTMDKVVSNAVAGPRFYMSVIAAFAAMALVLATVGIYGIVSYTTSQRSAEIGLRMALGASPRRVVQMLLRAGATQLLVGLGAGLVLAVAATRSIRQLLYGVQPLDSAVYVLVVLLVIAVAISAMLIPALRAARLNPNSARRYQ